MSTNDLSANKPLVLAITGASGVIYSLRMLDFLLSNRQKVELLISNAAVRVFKEEHDIVIPINGTNTQIIESLGLSPEFENYLVIHNLNDYGASVASGSYHTSAMVILPCSLGTLGAVAAGLSQNLIHRAALVTLKENRKLVIVLREMPFGQIQLRNMLTLSKAGAIISAASPGFYHKPKTIEDQIDFCVGKILDQLGFDNDLFKRWKQQ